VYTTARTHHHYIIIYTVVYNIKNNSKNTTLYQQNKLQAGRSIYRLDLLNGCWGIELLSVAGVSSEMAELQLLVKETAALSIVRELLEHR
jgi:hypothetical protein